MVPAALRDQVDRQDPKVKPDLRDQLDLKAQPVPRARPARKDLLGPKVKPDLKDRRG